MLNNNMVCKIENQTRDRRLAIAANRVVAAAAPMTFHMNCAAHSTVLCMKPIVQRIHPGLSGYVVRLGHLCQSSLLFCIFLLVIHGLVTSSFKYREGICMPAEAVAWKTHAKNTLDLTECSMDLTAEQKLNTM